MIDETTKAAIHRGAKVYVQAHAPTEAPLFDVFWNSVSEHLEALVARPSRFARLFSGSGMAAGSERWASPIVITFLTALLIEKPLGTRLPPAVDDIERVFKKVAKKHPVPELFWHQLIPIAEQVYRLNATHIPVHTVVESYERIDTDNDRSKLCSAPDAKSLCHQASTAQWNHTTFRIVMKVKPDESADCYADGKSISLGVAHTRFVTTLLVRRGRIATYVELSYIVHRVSLHTDLVMMATVTGKDKLEGIETRAAKRQMQKLKSRLSEVANGAALDAMVGRNARVGYHINPDVRFCLFIPVLRSIPELGQS